MNQPAQSSGSCHPAGVQIKFTTRLENQLRIPLLTSRPLP
jgi:hypothetical protein